MAAARSVLIAVATALIVGCLSPTSPDAVAGQAFELKVGATATLGDGLRIKFDGVSADSRCPIDAQCVRAGEAILSVSLVSSNATAETREMRTDATGSQISYANHTIQITSLAPYPRASQQINPHDYVATFVVQIP